MDEFWHNIKRGMRHIGRTLGYRIGVFLNFTLRRFYYLRKLPKRIFKFLQSSIILIVSSIERRLLRLPRIIRVSLYTVVIAGFLGCLLWGAYKVIPTAEDRRNRFFARGKSFFQDNRYPEALIELKNAVQLSSNFAQGHYYLALTYIYMGRLREAAAELYKCVLLDAGNINAILKFNAVQSLLKDPQYTADTPAYPKRGDDYMRGRSLMARVLLSSGDVQDAYADAQKVFGQKPDTFESNILMGDISLAQRDFEKAKAHYLRSLSLNPQSFEAHFKIGNLYLYDNDFTQALAQLETAAQLSPENPMVYSIMGDCYAYQNKYDAAIEKYQKAYAVDKRFVKALKSICNMLVFRGKLSEAAPYVEEFAQKAPDDPDALLTRAILRFSRQDTDTALADIEKSLKVRKDSLLAHFLYGRMLASVGRYTEARDELLAAIKINSRMTDPHIELSDVYLKLNDGEKALKEAERVIALNPHDLRAQLVRGKVYLQLKDYQHAQDCFQEIVQKFPDKPDAYFYLGVIYQVKNRIGKAVTEYLNALGRDINYVPAFYPLLDIYMNTKNYDKAVRLCDKMLRVHPNNASMHEVAGKLLAAFGKKDEAIKYYEKAVDLNPKQISTRLKLIDLYIAKNMRLNALQQCEDVLRIDPSHAPVLQRIAQLHQSLGNRTKAIEYYEKALRLQFDYVSANNAAWLYAQEGANYERALQLAEKAEIESKYETRILDTTAWILILMGRYDEALGRLEKVVAQESANPVYQYHLGLALYNKGLFADAGRALRQALKSPRAFEGQADAKKLLQELDAKGKE